MIFFLEGEGESDFSEQEYQELSFHYHNQKIENKNPILKLESNNKLQKVISYINSPKLSSFGLRFHSFAKRIDKLIIHMSRLREIRPIFLQRLS